MKFEVKCAIRNFNILSRQILNIYIYINKIFFFKLIVIFRAFIIKSIFLNNTIDSICNSK